MLSQPSSLNTDMFKGQSHISNTEDYFEESNISKVFNAADMEVVYNEDYNCDDGIKFGIDMSGS